MRGLPRSELILPIAIVGAAVLLGISEFMVTFQLTPPGAEPLRELSASDRHNYALLLLAIFAVGSMLFAIATGVRLAAIACAAFGGAALLLFLVLDLPDAGKLGDLDDPVFGLASARTVPQAGFWLEAVGAVALGLGSIAFATLSSDQLRAPTGWPRGGRSEGSRSAEDEPTQPAGERVPFDADAEQAPPRSADIRRSHLRRLSGSDR